MFRRSVWPHWRLRALAVLGMLFGMALSSMATRAESPQPLLLAVHPYLPEAEIKSRFAPLAGYLTKVLGQPVVVRVGPNYDEHIRSIGNDEVDIAFMGPAPYVELVSKYGKKPILVRLEINGQPFFDGYIVARKDNATLHALTDLKGKTFAFVEENSTMGHQVPAYMLLQAGIRLRDLADYRFLGGHKNVALAVLSGDADAGAVKDEVFLAYQNQGLRALAQSQQFSEHLFVTRSNLPPALIERLRTVLLGIKNSPEDMPILTSINPRMTGLVTATDSDYDSLRTVITAVNANRE